MTGQGAGERPDLVVLVADHDARRLVDGMVHRGQEPRQSCLARDRILQKGRERYPRLSWPQSFDEALRRQPKELFEELCHSLRLPRTPAIYQKVASGLSLPRLKASPAAARLAEQLEAWFPPQDG